MDNEIIVKLDVGMVHNDNVLNEDVLSFDLLENVTMKDSALVVEPIYLPFAQLGYGALSGIVDNYIYLFNASTKAGFFAIKMDKSIYWLTEPINEYFTLTHIGDLYSIPPVYDEHGIEVDAGELYKDDDPDAIMQSAFWNWQNANVAFFTKPGLPLYKAEGVGNELTIAKLDDTFNEGGTAVPLSAKYILITKDRSFIANVTVGGIRWYTRLHWSNLNKPDDFSVGLNKQSDYIFVGNNAEEITGLAYANDRVYVFCKNMIYFLDYENIETLFRLVPLNFTVGNIYHYAVINVNDVIYFCGKDNFYCVNDHTVEPIGDAIWNWFSKNLRTTNINNLPAQYEIKQKTITWIFVKQETNIVYGLKYNIENKTWSVKEMQADEYIL